MNYRHAFHAGNFADCMKHALLLALLGALRRKPAPFFVLDTHAGRGAYDLGAEADRTGEWRGGIGRLRDEAIQASPAASPAPSPLAPYLALVEELGLYPGSPRLIRAMLRADDRLACCELHGEDHAALRRLFARDKHVAVHLRDGWEALGALLPPAQRRGLVLIDPPYEQAGELDRLAAGLRTVAARFAPAIVAGWYPIKHRAPVRAFHETIGLQGPSDVVAAELWLRDPTDPARLNGCGLAIRNPPFGFEAEAGALLEALIAALATEPGSGWRVERLTAE